MWSDGADKRSIWIGFDPRETDAYAVAKGTFTRMAGPIPVKGLILDDLRAAGLYTRPTERRDGRLFDVISNHPMSTEFAISRFLVPHIAESGWALFADADMLCRSSLTSLMWGVAREFHDKAIVCVKHDHIPFSLTKMDGQVQTGYQRKNWSSFMFFNCEHPANRPLVTSTKLVNTLPGRDLHRFSWLDDYAADSDSLIGELDPAWNYLVGYSKPQWPPYNIHFTEGVPSMAGHENDEFADLWREELKAWAR